MPYVNGSTGVSVGAATSLSWSHTLSAGTNRTIVIAGSSWRNNSTSTLGTCTYDAQNCTTDVQRAVSFASNNYKAFLVHLPNSGISGSGSKTAVINLSESTNEIAGCVLAYDTIDQVTGPVRAGSTASNDNGGGSGTEASVSCTCTTVSGDICVSAENDWADANNGTRSTSDTIRQQALGGAADQTDCWGCEDAATGTSTVLNNTSCVAIVGMALIPASSGGLSNLEGNVSPIDQRFMWNPGCLI